MSEEVTATQDIAIPEPEVTEEVEEVVSETTEEEVKEGEVKETSDGLSLEEIASGTKKAKKGVQTRIDELTKEKYDAKREAEYWKNKANEVKPVESAVIPSDRPLPPAESDFIDTMDYKKARVEYEDRLDAWKTSHRQTVETKKKQEEEITANISKFNTNSTKMREKYSDFDKAINEPLFTPVLSNEVMSSEYGPEIGYYLAKNPSEAIKLNQLSEKAIAKEIGKLEVRFSQAVKKTDSNAPAPLSPLKGDESPIKDPSKMSDDEWYKYEQQQKLKKLKLVK